MRGSLNHGWTGIYTDGRGGVAELFLGRKGPLCGHGGIRRYPAPSAHKASLQDAVVTGTHPALRAGLV